MDWNKNTIALLADGLPCGYALDGPPASEPTALAVLALIGAGQHPEAAPGLNWLSGVEQTDGQTPPYSKFTGPGWPTPLAILAGLAASREGAHAALNIERAQAWLLSARGNPLPISPTLGHDTSLVGWPWVLGTHSWQEPTAWSVIALKALGLWEHPRTREGVRLLIDRLLPEGGCNYGNTSVFGQWLRPHVEPTGVTMLALAGEQSDDPRLERSLEYLSSTISAETTAMSLSCALLGLAAHDLLPRAAATWLAGAYKDVMQHGSSPFQLALLVLASQGRECPLITCLENQEPSEISR